jgi:hypothetical protein
MERSDMLERSGAVERSCLEAMNSVAALMVAKMSLMFAAVRVPPVRYSKKIASPMNAQRVIKASSAAVDAGLLIMKTCRKEKTPVAYQKARSIGMTWHSLLPL